MLYLKEWVVGCVRLVIFHEAFMSFFSLAVCWNKSCLVASLILSRVFVIWRILKPGGLGEGFEDLLLRITLFIKSLGNR